MDDDAPPLPARFGDKTNSSVSGTNRSLSFSSSSSKDAPQPTPPPIPSRPSTMTSSRSNSITGGAGGSIGLISGGDSSFKTTIGGAQSTESSSSYVSSLLTRNPSTSNNISSSDGPSRSSILGTSSGLISGQGDRINPFDKNVTTATVSNYNSSGGGEAKETPGTTLDDLIKNRFAQQTGQQATGEDSPSRFKPRLSDTKAEPSFEELKNELFRKEEKRPERKWSETDSVFASSPKVVNDTKPTATPSSFSKLSRTSSSDADIIFGSASAVPSARPKYNYSIDSQSSISSETDNIFARKGDEGGRAFIKSLSVSSTDDRDFSADPRVKNFEGIQNAAFQDYDSGMGSLGTDSGIGALKSATGSTSSASSSYKWSSNRVTEEDYDDLK